jgi:glycosyltransferase involved in cell wall biosynthesis
MQKLLIIGLVWPEPKSSAAGSRMLQLISAFMNQGFQITFASAAQESEFSFDNNDLKIDKVGIELNSDSFDVFVKNLNPAIVLFDRFVIEEQYGWRVAVQCPDALRALDTEDLHCLRAARQEALKKNKDFVAQDLLVEPISKREIASILRCDLSLIISEFEMNLLKNVFKIATDLCYYLPFLVDKLAENHLKNLPDFNQRKDFVFIGNFFHEPNIDAVLHLKQNIWPLLKKEFTTAQLCIYGAYMPKKITQLHNPKEGFCVMGRANNALEVLQQARILIAPLRFGAGLKGKLLEAMQCGTPSICSTIGAEAMAGNLPWNGYIADDLSVFIKQAILYYKDETHWKTAQKNGLYIVNHRFDKHLFESNFKEKITSIQQNLQQHRQNNFIGQLLLHHTANSSKYLSKWIEAKNSKL